MKYISILESLNIKDLNSYPTISLRIKLLNFICLEK